MKLIVLAADGRLGSTLSFALSPLVSLERYSDAAPPPVVSRYSLQFHGRVGTGRVAEPGPGSAAQP